MKSPETTFRRISIGEHFQFRGGQGIFVKCPQNNTAVGISGNDLGRFVSLDSRHEVTPACAPTGECYDGTRASPGGAFEKGM